MAKMTVQQRTAAFWAKVDKSGGEGACWIWQGTTDKDGYGSTSWFYKSIRSHRLAYRLTVGEIPAGQLVLHACDNPPCCNPQHLTIGTHADNVKDRVAKDRSAKATRHGSVTHPERVLRGLHHPGRLHPERNARGEQNGAAVLSETQVREIRSRYEHGGISHARLAQEYGVSKSIVGNIIRRRNWAHID